MKYFQNNLKLTISGKSHDAFITLCCENVPELAIDYDLINQNLAKRRGIDYLSTPRREPDRYEIIQKDGKITIIVYNEDIIDQPFDGLVRPGHADLVQLEKYQDEEMIKGGGIASGRLTAPIVILGSLFAPYLMKKGLIVKSFIEKIGSVELPNVYYDDIFAKDEDYISHTNDEYKDKIEEEIMKAKAKNDSIDGLVKTFIKCPIIGLGEPFFNSFESIMAHLLFSIPAINGIAFGDAFKNIHFGSSYNDEPYYENNQLKYRSNHSGGINGGLSNSNYICFTSSIRPTSSIGITQKTINYLTKENAEIKINGRNDPCIVPRVSHVISAVSYIALMDLLLEGDELWIN